MNDRKHTAGDGDPFAGAEAYLRYLKSVGVRTIPAGEGVAAFLSGKPRRRRSTARRAQLAPPPADPRDPYFERPWVPPDGVMTLEEVRAHLGECRRCKLHAGRTNVVFGVGDPQAELVFVGEAPGADEDRLGEPFVGRAGQLLDRMIAAMGKKRGDVYICNVLKSRPPGNRDPEADEVLACEPFLIKQIEAIAPRVICALGSHAARTLLRTNQPIGKLRGRFHYYHDVKVLPTFHPAYLLRNPAEKRAAWQDLQMVMAELGWKAPASGGAAR